MNNYDEALEQLEAVASEIYVEYNHMLALVNKLNDQLDRMEKLIILIKGDLLAAPKIDNNN